MKEWKEMKLGSCHNRSNTDSLMTILQTRGDAGIIQYLHIAAVEFGYHLSPYIRQI
jgi:hypothetical protein